MWIVIGVVVLVLILLVVSSNAGRKQQMEQARLELTAEHQRLQRENPEHADAKMGLEEFILSRLNEGHAKLRDNKRQMLRAGARFGLIGGVITIAGWLIFLSVFGLPFDALVGFVLPLVVGGGLGFSIGVVFTRIKQGQVRLRTQAE